MGDKGEGGVKNLKKCVTSFKDGPLLENRKMFMLSKFSMICIVMPSIIRFSRYDLIVIKFNGFVTNSHIDFVRNCLEKAADACLFSIYLPDFVCKMMMQFRLYKTKIAGF